MTAMSRGSRKTPRKRAAVADPRILGPEGIPDIDSAVGDFLRGKDDAALKRIARAAFSVSELDGVEPTHVDRLELFDAVVDQARLRVAERDCARRVARRTTGSR